MEHYLNEKTVMRFYIDQIDADKIAFLRNKDEAKAAIKKDISALIDEEKMNSKIRIAVGLWKKLFEASMSFLSPNKSGYDKIFEYFDSYVEFEELIFASDSFYRDHTLHCLWVYFLGEYIARNEEFSPLFMTSNGAEKTTEIIVDVSKELKLFNAADQKKLEKLVSNSLKTRENIEVSRCVAALTHDLGYPLKKIEKINKSIRKVIPFYGINSFRDFNFEYGTVQQEFVNGFIDFISRSESVDFSPNERAVGLLQEIWKTDDYGCAIGYNEQKVKGLSEDERKLVEGSIKLEDSFASSFKAKAQYYTDFENYQHGIMSAFLLIKNVMAFQEIYFDAKNDAFFSDGRETTKALHSILKSITDHTCEGFRIHVINEDSFLTFVDELEEFSRISRASQNREYVEEFCDTAIYMEDGWFNVIFEFNNDELDNLDPERAFKGRCKRFLSLFTVPHLDEFLKIRVKVIGNLKTNQNEYVLEIAKKYAKITVNGEEMNIPKYLKSNQFFTREEYANQ